MAGIRESEPFKAIMRMFEGIQNQNPPEQGDIEILGGYIDATEANMGAQGKARIRKMIGEMVVPINDKTSWKVAMNQKTKLHNQREANKKRLVENLKATQGRNAIIPEELEEIKAPDTKELYFVKNDMTMGVDPFANIGEENTTVKLQYAGTLTWAEFKNRCLVEVNPGATDKEKRITIKSLTIEGIIEEAQRRGLTHVQLGKLLLDFTKQTIPELASKANSMESDELDDVLTNLENVIDVDKEIKEVEKALNSVKREPGEDISIPGASYRAKQIILTRLRASKTVTRTSSTVTKGADSVTITMLLELVHPRVKTEILDIRAMHFKMMNLEWTYQSFITEVREIEKKNPTWNIKSTMYCQSRGMFSLKDAGINVNKIEMNEAETDQEGQGEEYIDPEEDYDDPAYYDSPSYDNDGDGGEDVSSDDEVHRDDTGALFLFRGRPLNQRRGRSGGAGAGRPGPMKRQGTSPGQRGASGRGGPKRPGVNVLQGESRGRGRDAGRRNSRGGSQNRGRSGYTRPRAASEGRRFTSGAQAANREMRCFRCNSKNHRSKSCPRFKAFCQEACHHCKKDGKTLFHPPLLCPFRQGSGYITPAERTSAEREMFGFRAQSPASPITVRKNV